MSTRSRKKIHGSLQENTINIDTKVAIESHSKLRKRKLKENCDFIDKTLLKPNKRNNYVTYPTTGGDGQIECLDQEKPVEDKRIRKILRSTLKDQNNKDSTLLSDSDQDDIPKKTKSTRRKKKQADETIKEQNIAENSIAEVHKMRTKKTSNDEANKSYEIVAEASVCVPKKTKDKRKKKSKSPVSKKNVENETENVIKLKKLRKKKKGKRYKSSENNIVQINNMKNGSVHKSNLSTDSFHSAAGSPLKDSANEVKVSVSLKCPKHDNILQDESSCIKNETNDKIDTENQLKLNTTYDKSPKEINTTYDKDDKTIASDHNDTTSDTNKRDSKSKLFGTENKPLNTILNKNDPGVPNRKSSDIATLTPKKKIKSIDSTFNKDLNVTENDNTINTNISRINDTVSTTNHLNSTFDKKPKLDETFEKSDAIKNSISPLVSLDATNSTINVTLDKSVTSTPINITSDDSNMENILNVTPVMVDSSTNKSNSKMTPERSGAPLQREGTFTKDPTDENLRIYKKTPTKRMSLPSPGCTPLFVRTEQNDKFAMNHHNDIKSAEKSRRSSAFAVELPSRTTKVMFCSPVHNPGAQTERKNKVIKSSMKGSNKSFVLMDNAIVPAAGRKRSLPPAPAQGCAEGAAAKRRRCVQRARSDIAEARTLETGKAAKAPITGAARRTALPDFAALHARSFGQMESLSEFKERRARRARQLLTPTAPVASPAPSAPRRAAPPTPDPLSKSTLKKMDSENKKLHTLESLRPGYTRFGFKMNVEANPFDVSNKSESKVKEYKPKNTMKRQPMLPSLAGVTSSWKDIAKSSVMREKSSTSLTERRDGKRKEYRTIIKGVRTNRRFELQMKSRNING